VNCIDTNKIIDIHIELPDELLRQVEAQTGVKISEYTINFYGHSE
jgi:Fur family ferric uptake transcriptional regulator